MTGNRLSRAAAVSPSATAPLVQLDGVRKLYRRHVILNNVSLTVGAGEFVAIIGASGCGKSTLLNIVGLLERPDAGRLRLFGSEAPDVGSARARRMLRGKLGYVFQNAALIDKDTVGANLKLAQSFQHSAPAQKRAARAAALASVGLAGIGETRRVYELSGGEQLRLAIARLLLRPNELILADEPTGSLDTRNRDEVLELLKGLRDQGRTIIVVTHDPTVAAAADRTVALDAG